MVTADGQTDSAPASAPAWEPLERRVHMTAAPHATGWRVLVIDATLPDAAALVAAADQQKVLLFNPRSETPQDVLRRVVELSRTTGRPIETLSVLSHGRRGAFQLGDQLVTSDNLPRLHDQLTDLSRQLAPGGRILLFGCDTADGVSGRRLLERLASLTGASVFGSTDLTGAAGDWDLEAASTRGPSMPAARLPFNTAALLSSAVTLALPAGWTSSDIGTVAHAGSTDYDAGTGLFTVRGSGNDIWTVDNFQYARTTVSGNLDIVVRVRSQDHTHDHAKAGIMLRESTANNSRYVMVARLPGQPFRLQYRAEPGGATARSELAGPTALPVWLRLSRTGDVFRGFISYDGVEWTQIGSTTVDLPDTTMAGLAVTARASTLLGSATFDGLGIRTLTYAAEPRVDSLSAWSGGATASLSVLGEDPAGEGGLTYTWSKAYGPAGSTVAFDVNGTNAAKNVVASFNKIGRYTLLVTAQNALGQTATRSLVVHVGPKHWYKLEPSAGNVVPDSGYGNLTATHSTINYWSDGGRDGQGWVANTSSVTANVGDLGDRFTLSAWLNPNTVTGTKTIYTNGSNAAVINGFRFHLQQPGAAAGTLVFYTGNGTLGLTVTSAANIVPTGVWSHVAAVVDRVAGTVRFYLNGADVTPGVNAIRTDFATALPLRMGATTNDRNYWKGGVDDLRVYETTLSGTEVLQTATEGPAAPTLTLTPQLHGVRLDWVANSGNETRFEIARSANGGSTWSTRAVVGGDIRMWTDPELTAIGTYHYRIRASDGSFNSLYTTQSAVLAPVATTFQTAPLPSAGVVRVAAGTSLRFTAVWLDQFGAPLTGQPPLTWTLDPGSVGSIDSDGLYTAPSASGTAVVRVTDGVETRTFNVSVRPATIDYSGGFASTDGLQLNGSPVVTGGRLQMSSHIARIGTGTAYAANRVDIRRFSTYFTFAYNTGAQADALTFIVQNHSATAIGTSGGPDASTNFSKNVYLRLQLYNNVSELGLGKSAVLQSNASTRPAGVDLHADNHTFAAYIAYDGTTLVATITNLTIGRSYTASYAVDIPTTVGGEQAWVGFSQGMGGSWATQEVLGWSFTSHHPLITTDPTPATATTAAPTMDLSADATDDDGAGNLTYTWSTVSAPDGASVLFSANGTNAAKSTTASFDRAGVYTLRLTVSDGTYTTVHDLSFTVDQQLTSIVATPAAATTTRGGTVACSAVAYDQFGQAMPTQPAFAWAATDGSVAADGTFTADGTLGPVTLTASAGGVDATTTVTVTNTAPTFAVTARADASTVTAKSVTLRALGADDEGEASLTYRWELVSGPAAVQFGVNGSNAAKVVAATFTRAGNYTFRVIVQDADGATVGGTVVVAVTQTATDLQVTPAVASLEVGQGVRFTVAARDQFGDTMTVDAQWTVQTPALGNIDQDGRFTAQAAGVAKVAATVGDLSVIARVTVTVPEPPPPPPPPPPPTDGSGGQGQDNPGAGMPPDDAGPATPPVTGGGGGATGGPTPGTGGGSGTPGSGGGGTPTDGGAPTQGGNPADGGPSSPADPGQGNPDPGSTDRPGDGGEQPADGGAGNPDAGAPDGGGPEAPNTTDPGSNTPPGRAEGNPGGGTKSDGDSTGGSGDAPSAGGSGDSTAGAVSPAAGFSSSAITTAPDGTGDPVLATGDPTMPSVRFAEASFFASGKAAALSTLVPDGLERVVDTHVQSADLASAVVNPLTHHDSALARELDQVNKEMSQDMRQMRIAVGSASATVAASAFAYVIWILRSGLLLAGVLESLPLWNWFDPMPVLRKPEEVRHRRFWDPRTWFGRGAAALRYTTARMSAAPTDDKQIVKAEVDADEQRIRSLIEQTTARPLAAALAEGARPALPGETKGDPDAHA